jgi:hypothetical protein
MNHKNGPKRLFQDIEERFVKAGYKLPRLVFWNVGSRTNTIPMIQNELGVILVSGFSPHICSMIMGNETDPWEVLIKKLLSSRYEPIIAG